MADAAVEAVDSADTRQEEAFAEMPAGVSEGADEEGEDREEDAVEGVAKLKEKAHLWRQRVSPPRRRGELNQSNRQRTAA